MHQRFQESMLVFTTKFALLLIPFRGSLGMSKIKRIYGSAGRLYMAFHVYFTR